jgi:glycosyltransferase involved in cell wall biosynthesis
MLDGIIVHNKASKSELLKYIRHQSKPIAVIPHMNYLDYIGGKIDKRKARDQLNIAVDGPLFLFFGQIKQVKGLDIAIRALADLRRSVSNARLLIAGRPWKTKLSEYTMLIKELHLENNVIMHSGFIPREKVDLYYYSSDAVLLPYRKIYQSGVLLMAMSYGIPVIASNLPGMRDTILENENGLLFTVDDSHALSQRMLAIIENQYLAERIGQKGREHVVNYHDIKKICHSTAEFYHTVCPDAHSVPPN